MLNTEAWIRLVAAPTETASMSTTGTAASFVPGDVAARVRGEIRGAFNFADSAVPPDPCRITLEMFDNATGRTAIALNATVRRPRAQ